jgi:hypothetical protein
MKRKKEGGRKGCLFTHIVTYPFLHPLAPSFPPRFGMVESGKTRRSILVGWMNPFLIGR